MSGEKVYNAALYIRLSKDDGTSESSSVATQRKMLRAYALEHNFFVYDEYVDGSDKIGLNRQHHNRPVGALYAAYSFSL